MVYDADIPEFSLDTAGGWLIFRTRAGAGTRDLVFVPPGESGESSLGPSQSEFNESAPAVSPDGRWIAYTSTRSGSTEVWIAPFPLGNADDARRISASGGWRPVWAPGGDELFFVQDGFGSRELMVVEIDDSASLRIGTPTALFALPGEIMVNNSRDFYDVAPDGQRFLMAREVEGKIERELIRVLNFHVAVRAQVPN